MAFEYFNRKKVDVSIIEVGLGGRFDSTNVIKPLISVITNVAFDHMDYLGNSIGEIAREKAGIIKEEVPVITGALDIPGLMIEKVAKEHESPLYMLEKDFFYEKIGDQRMSYSGLNKKLPDIFVNLKGDYQFANVAVALCAIEVLLSLGFPVDEKSIYNALSNIRWQGRLEVVKEKPVILLDGAHNPHGAHALSEFISTHYMDKRKILIFGVMRDKEYQKILEEITPFMDTIILTKPNIERALPPDCMKVHAKDAIVTEDVRSALTKARAIARDRDLILVTGSFYTIGEAKTIIDEVF
jgi:dihydrofolate synthase/folylpolyglutamate synthase